MAAAAAGFGQRCLWLHHWAGQMAATVVAAGTGAPAGTESAEGAPGPAAALELWLSE